MVLRAEGIRAALPGAATLASNEGVSFSVDPGEALQVSGRSGSGKSTLLRILARLCSREAGSLWLGDQDGSAIPPSRWRRRVHYLHQNPTMLPGSVEDNLKAGFVCALGSRGQLPRGRAEALLEQLGLSTQQLQQQAATLSGGEAARIALIRGLLIEPEVLLADELLAHLDSEVAEAVASLLERWLQQAAGRALIFVGHEEAPWRLIPHRRVTLERGDGP